MIFGLTMKKYFKFLLPTFYFLFLTSSVFAFQPSALTNKIDAIIQNRCLADAKIGIKIVSLKTGETIYERDSGELLIPASNMKLITSAAALTRLKPNYKFKTTVSYDGTIDGNILNGNLYVKGYGDPKLVTEELLLIVREIRNSGIDEISGDIIADESFFDSERTGNGWNLNDDNSRAYNARIGALSLNFNTITVYVDSAESHRERPKVVTNPPTSFVEVINNAVTNRRRVGTTITVDRIEDGGGDKIIVKGEVTAGKKRMHYYRNISNPPLYTATVFKEFLEREGISIKGNIKIGIQPEGVEEFLDHESVPLSIIVRDLNKISNNFIAEQILKTMGAEIKGAPGTAEKGLSVIEEYLNEIGIQKGAYTIADGSGLSRFNRLTPSQIVKVLESMYDDFRFQSEYISSLSVMGIDGSLKERMNGSGSQEMVRGKTGTLDDVSAISGYAACVKCNSCENCSLNRGEIFAFSIIMNDFRCNIGKVWDIQNQIISALTDKI
jgi:D-alanyl-D-alanine carboxypeptidase/D-alanyl-D-alanine-endopeptidase (penicillin-binding protein 4)